MLKELIQSLDRATTDKRHLVILRGLPGSGKTELAQFITKNVKGPVEIVSLDDCLLPDRKLHGPERAEISVSAYKRTRIAITRENGPAVVMVDTPAIFNEDVAPYVMLAMAEGAVPHIAACLSDPYIAYQRSKKFLGEHQLAQLIPKFIGEITHQPPFWPKAIHVYIMTLGNAL